MPRFALQVAAILALCVVLNAPAADSPATPVADFSLRDSHGRSYSLAEVSEPVVVVAFLGTECPLANLYAPRLNELAKQYSACGVAFLAIDSNRQDSNREVAEFARRHRLTFPLLKDLGNHVADQFDALRTPEVFLLDQQRTVCYRGRIDDQYEARGAKRSSPDRRYLADAIDELLAGKTVSNPRAEPEGCFIGRTTIAKANRNPSTAPITWSQEISRIFQKRCQECHRADQLAPFALLTYEDSVGWAETIREVVREERMPPWNANPEFGHFSNDSRLTAEEKNQIIAWVDGGAPEGILVEAPAPRAFAPGWRIPQPDQIVYMSEKPFTVPAEGTVDYQWFYVDPGFTSDRWIRAVEARPGCRRVVHHITVYFKPPGGEWNMRMNDRINLLGGFNPGGEPLVFPDGMAMRLPAGTEFAFEMHYTPDGVVEQDRSYVGLCFADPATVQHETMSFMPADTELKIPPGDAKFRSAVKFPIEQDIDLLVLRPHMHLRGKSFRYEAIYPGGGREVLLDVPRFSFDWQHSYYLTEPKHLPAGTMLNCTATFDNSSDNPANPNPKATVRWGDQSWDEMMIGTFCAASSAPVSQSLFAADSLKSLRWPAWLFGLGAIALTAFIWSRRARRVSLAN